MNTKTPAGVFLNEKTETYQLSHHPTGNIICPAAALKQWGLSENDLPTIKDVIYLNNGSCVKLNFNWKGGS